MSRPLLPLPTAQTSDVDTPATPLIAAQTGVAVAGTSTKLVPFQRVVNVRPLQPV